MVPRVRTFFHRLTVYVSFRGSRYSNGSANPYRPLAWGPSQNRMLSGETALADLVFFQASESLPSASSLAKAFSSWLATSSAASVSRLPNQPASSNTSW